MNYFGSIITIVSGTSEFFPFQLPMPSKSGRYEDFIPVHDLYENLSGNMVRKVRGYRLKCKYYWERINSVDGVLNSDFHNMIDIINASQDVYLQFADSGNVTYYGVVVESYRHGLRDGLMYNDSFEITFTGKALLSAYPIFSNPVTMVRPGGIMTITV